jgi:hypothetical protein
MTAHLVNHRFRGGLQLQRLVCVLVVDVVADADELAVLVAARQQDDGDADDFAVRDARQVRRVGLEDEFVDADGDGPHGDGVELLVVFIAGCRADVGEFPFEVYRAGKVSLWEDWTC